jgi:hypothetical protein
LSGTTQEVAEKLHLTQRKLPQRLKPALKAKRYRSGEPLRHPKIKPADEFFRDLSSRALADLLDSAFEDFFGEVAFGGVGDDCDDALAFTQAAGDLHCRVYRGTAAGAGQDTFLRG